MAVTSSDMRAFALAAVKNLKGILIALAVIAAIAFAWWGIRSRRARSRAEATADSLTATVATADSQRRAAQHSRDSALAIRDTEMSGADLLAGQVATLNRTLRSLGRVTDSMARVLDSLDNAGVVVPDSAWHPLYLRSRIELTTARSIIAADSAQIAKLRRADSASQAALKADSVQMRLDATRLATYAETVAGLRKPRWRLAGIPLPNLSVGYGVTIARDSLVRGKIHAVDGPTASLSYTIHF